MNKKGLRKENGEFIRKIAITTWKISEKKHLNIFRLYVKSQQKETFRIEREKLDHEEHVYI